MAPEVLFGFTIRLIYLNNMYSYICNLNETKNMQLTRADVCLPSARSGPSPPTFSLTPNGSSRHTSGRRVSASPRIVQGLYR